jgi:hypothetical protein
LDVEATAVFDEGPAIALIVDQFAHVVLAKDAADGVTHAGVKDLILWQGIVGLIGVSDPVIVNLLEGSPSAIDAQSLHLLETRAVEDRQASAKAFEVGDGVVKALPDNATGIATACSGCAFELNA